MEIGPEIWSPEVKHDLPPKNKHSMSCSRWDPQSKEFAKLIVKLAQVVSAHSRRKAQLVVRLSTMVFGSSDAVQTCSSRVRCPKVCIWWL